MLPKKSPQLFMHGRFNRCLTNRSSRLAIISIACVSILAAATTSIERQTSASIVLVQSVSIQQSEDRTSDSKSQSSESLPLSGDDRQFAEQLSRQVSTAEWLGPLASIALSPYFGITCLAGMAQFGEGTFLESNGLISQNRVLKSPYVFWIFLFLTVATSLPRLTKISKPIAQVLDRVETYSAIITLIVIRLAATETTTEPEVAGNGTNFVVAAGVISWTFDGLMLIAAAINVMVISTVRFVCELLVWLSPFPAVDAVFELGNKTVAAGLMALYSYSPLLALMVNVLFFAACAAVYLPVHRRAVYLRSLMVDPVLVMAFPQMAQLRGGEMVVFNKHPLGGFPALSKLYLRRCEDGWILRRPGWLVGSTEIQLASDTGPMLLESGFLVNRIRLTHRDDAVLIFSRRYNRCLEDVCNALALTRKDSGVTAKGVELA
jgi:hypothetical protein